MVMIEHAPIGTTTMEMHSLWAHAFASPQSPYFMLQEALNFLRKCVNIFLSLLHDSEALHAW
jgi:hypothetical protein